MEQDLTRRRVQEVSPPHHLAHALGGVVHYDGPLVGGGAVVAAHDEVVNLPLQRSKQPILEGYAVVLRSHPQGWRAARDLALGPLGCRKLAAGSGVTVGGGDPVRRGGGGPDLRPRAIAWIEESVGVETS